MLLVVEMAGGEEEEVAVPQGAQADLKYHAQLMPNKLNLATDKGDLGDSLERLRRAFQAEVKACERTACSPQKMLV